jgi:site-specific DNA-methyltransferase (adenine-specific)
VLYSDKYLNERFNKVDENGRRFKDEKIGTATSQATIDRLKAEGKIYVTSSGKLRIKHYLDEIKGVPLDDVWYDIPPINSQASERLGYPTQKPEPLLERIIRANSNEGDIVLDPFCGCGTAIVVANNLNRKWIGIDITHLAISAMKWRLEKMFPNIQYKVIGEPKDLAGARELAKQNKYQFQWWAVSLVHGQPYGDKKKGADTGIDGYLYFKDEKDKVKKAIIQVKGGNMGSSHIRDLIGVVHREKAEMGLFLCLESITKPMQLEADSEGFYHSPLGRDYPKIQILTIEQLLEHKKPDVPPWIAPMDAPPIAKRPKGKTIKLI